jgi:hypothetical protein
MTIQADTRPLGAMMQEWRQQLHAHPELAFQEHKTADDTCCGWKALALRYPAGLPELMSLACTHSGGERGAPYKQCGGFAGFAHQPPSLARRPQDTVQRCIWMTEGATCKSQRYSRWQ